MIVDFLPSFSLLLQLNIWIHQSSNKIPVGMFCLYRVKHDIFFFMFWCEPIVYHSSTGFLLHPFQDTNSKKHMNKKSCEGVRHREQIMAFLKNPFDCIRTSWKYDRKSGFANASRVCMYDKQTLLLQQKTKKIPSCTASERTTRGYFMINKTPRTGLLFEKLQLEPNPVRYNPWLPFQQGSIV